MNLSILFPLYKNHQGTGKTCSYIHLSPTDILFVSSYISITVVKDESERKEMMSAKAGVKSSLR